MNLIITNEQLSYLVENLLIYEQYHQTTHVKYNVQKRFDCMTLQQSLAVEYVLSHKLPIYFIRVALGIIGRESKYGNSAKYAFKVAPEYLFNKLSEFSPTFKTITKSVGQVMKGDSNWTPSMGMAQMTPDLAKKYGVSLESLLTLSGSLLAVTKHVMELYKIASQKYDTNVPSVINSNGQIIPNPSSSGNAALDASIIAYNIGQGSLGTNYCLTNNKEFLGPCNAQNNEYLPYPKDKPDFKLQVFPDKIIKNYLPNRKTDTGKNTYISTHGYLKEVVGYVRKFICN